MNLEEIKQWKSKSDFETEHTEVTSEVIDFLMNEVERLEIKCKEISAEYQQELIDSMKEMMYDVAEECAVIAEYTVEYTVYDEYGNSCADIDYCADNTANIIREKYGRK